MADGDYGSDGLRELHEPSKQKTQCDTQTHITHNNPTNLYNPKTYIPTEPTPEKSSQNKMRVLKIIPASHNNLL